MTKRIDTRFNVRYTAYPAMVGFFPSPSGVPVRLFTGYRRYERTTTSTTAVYVGLSHEKHSRCAFHRETGLPHIGRARSLTPRLFLYMYVSACQHAAYIRRGDNKVVSSLLLTEYSWSGFSWRRESGHSVSAAETFPFYWNPETSIARKRGSFRLLAWNPNWVTCEHLGRVPRDTLCMRGLTDVLLDPSYKLGIFQCPCIVLLCI